MSNNLESNFGPSKACGSLLWFFPLHALRSSSFSRASIHHCCSWWSSGSTGISKMLGPMMQVGCTFNNNLLLCLLLSLLHFQAVPNLSCSLTPFGLRNSNFGMTLNEVQLPWPSLQRRFCLQAMRKLFHKYLSSVTHVSS